MLTLKTLLESKLAFPLLSSLRAILLFSFSRCDKTRNRANEPSCISLPRQVRILSFTFRLNLGPTCASQPRYRPLVFGYWILYSLYRRWHLCEYVRLDTLKDITYSFSSFVSRVFSSFPPVYCKDLPLLAPITLPIPQYSAPQEMVITCHAPSRI